MIVRNIRAALIWLVCCVTGFAADSGRFTSICDCEWAGMPCRGVFRWAVKTDTNRDCQSFIVKRVTPSQIGRWGDVRPDETTGTYRVNAPRSGREKLCWELTGRVMQVKAEPDGDLHVQLQDATGSNTVNVIVEIPSGEPWCEARTRIFFLANEQPPFNAPKTLTLITNAVVTVTGKAFFDGSHAGGTHLPNRRSYDSDTTIWEIHPVMSVQIR